MHNPGWGAPLVPVNLKEQLTPTLEQSTASGSPGGIISVGSLEVDLAEVAFGHLIGEGGFGKV
eukprot:scaffold102907_cov46-Prasinocladus_malaysianus.AAC.1